MAQKTYEKKNYVFLYRGLAVVRDALLKFIIDSLKSAYGESWWEKGVAPAFRPEDLENLKTQFNKRFSNPSGPSRPGSELYEILDINYLVMVVENRNNWKNAFAGRLNNDRTLLSYIREIILFRNPVAHPETGDLKDDDAFRGLDSGERLLRLIDQDAANEIMKIKDEFRHKWIFDEVHLRNLTTDEVGIDLFKGLDLLEDAIQASDGRSSQAYNSFAMLKMSLLSNLELERKLGFTTELGSERKQMLERLNQLSSLYLHKSFTDACIVIAPPKLTHEQAREKVHNLKKYIKRLETELKNLELDQTFQLESHTISEYTNKKILQLKERLQTQRSNYEALWLEVSPDAYFEIQRTVEARKVLEENPLQVKIVLRNLGRKSTHVEYSEGMSQGMVFIRGQTNFSGEIRAQEAVTLTYQIYCNRPGRYSLHTEKLDYPEKVQGWDEVADTEINCMAGNAPELTGTRYYQFTPDGIEVIVQIHNEGNMIAHGINIDQTIPVRGAEAHVLSFSGDLFPQQEVPIIVSIPVGSPHTIDFPATTTIPYEDHRGRRWELSLDQKFSLLEYTYPTLVEISGRQQELKVLDVLIKEIANDARGLSIAGKSRTVLVEGEEGVGKTRFIEEVMQKAKTWGFQCFCVDSTDRAPVQQLLRLMLGLRANEANQDRIWDALEQAVPDSETNLKQRALIVRYLASQTEEQYDIHRLNAGIVDLVNNLSQTSPLLLVVENAHRTPEGVETSLFQYLIKGINLTGESRLILCATYRPRGQALPSCFAGVDLQAYGFTKIVLKALDPQSAEKYVDQLIPFPRLSTEVKNLVFEWSKNNPLYLKEFLRHIMNPAKGFVQRLGNFWYPSANLEPANLPETLSDIILWRVKEELGENLGILQTLSVLGLEAPWSLMMAVLRQEFPDLRQEELEGRIVDLEKARFINIRKRNEANSEELVYEFEHQAKRESIYNDEEGFQDIRKRRVRDQIVKVLDDPGNQFFIDEEEKIRQIARHILRSNTHIKFEKREYLRRAANIEEKRQNFNRCLEYYASFLSALSDREYFLERSQTQYAMGKIYKLQGKWHECASALNMALEDLEGAQKSNASRAEIKRLQGRIFAEQGGLLIKQKQYEKANDILYSARKNYEGALGQWWWFSPKGKAYFYEDLVEIYLNLAEIWSKKLDVTNSIMLFQSDSTSKKAIQRAEAYAQKYTNYFDDIGLLVKVYIFSGELYYVQRNMEQATKWLEKALELIEGGAAEVTSTHSHERALSLLAEIYQKKGLTDKARESYLKALHWQEQVQDYLGLGITYGGLGQLFLNEKLYADARFHLERAYHFQKLVGDADRIWKTSFSLFEASMHDEDYEEAERYWQLVRMTLPEHFHELPLDKQTEIFEAIKSVADRHKREKSLEDAIRYYTDAKVFARSNKQIAQVDMALSEIYRERKEIDNAMRAVHDALDLTEDPLEQADLYSILGDICNLSRDHSLKVSAREHYEKSIELYVKEKLNKDAFHAYEKFLRAIEDDREGLYDLSVTLNNFIDLMLNHHDRVDIRFVEHANSVFIKKQRFREAGHALTNLVAKIAYRGFEQEQIDQLSSYLAKAEELYLKSKNHEDWIEGFNRLISVYFAVNQWDKIVYCYKRLLAICADTKNPTEFLDTFRAILMLNDKLDNLYLKELVNVVNKTQVRLTFTDTQKKEFVIQVAKCFHHIADKSEEKSETEMYLDLALQQYEIALKDVQKFDDHKLGESIDQNMIEVALNDSALILQQMKKYDEARRRLTKSVHMAVNMKNKFGEACSRANLANLLVRLNEYKNAEAEYEESIRILLGVKAYWDERIENLATSPLTSYEVAQWRFQRNWIASVAENYGGFIYRTDQSKGSYLLGLAKEIYENQDDNAAAARVGHMIEIFTRIFPGRPFPMSNLQPFYDSQTSLQDQYLSCGNCEYRYDKSLIDCPKCGYRTCPNCLHLCLEQEEYCPDCDTYLGTRGLYLFQ